MVRHCRWLLTSFQMKTTGRTAYCSRMGKEYRREIFEFAEQVLFRISESSGPGATVWKLMPRWDLGVWVGKVNDSDEHVLLTPFGSRRSRSIRRLPETSKWNADFLTVRGVPWNPMEAEVEKVSTVDIGKSRRLHITRAMITESGQTPGCFGCMGVQEAHDENCRKRFERIYLHTAAVPTFATSVREGTSAPEAPVETSAPLETSAEGDTIADQECEEDGTDGGNNQDVVMDDLENKRQKIGCPPGLETSTEAAAEPVEQQANEGKRRRVAGRIEDAVESLMDSGHVGMIMAVQEAIESDEGEQEEPHETWGGKGWLETRLVRRVAWMS